MGIDGIEKIEKIALERMATDMHHTLNKIYHFSKDACSIFSHNVELVYTAQCINKMCLKGGLFEIYTDEDK